MEEEEEWRYVPNFPEYVVSNFGSIHKAGQIRGRHLILRVDNSGSVVVNLRPDGDQEYQLRLDRIVAAAFLGAFNTSTPVFGEVVHLDGNLRNCRVDNLVWVEE